MPQELLFQTSPETATNELLLKQHIAKLIRVDVKEIQHISILKRSIDARQKAVKFNLKVTIYLVGESIQEAKIELPEYKNVANAQ
ncbi:MAG TPA: FAD-binding protein, partial [Flavobacterium alvei]|nr:FAD-binding protein [Flavobacterium alvei]